MRQIRRCPEVGKPAAVEPHPAVPDRRLAAARVWQTAGWSGKPPFIQEPSEGSISDRCPLAPGLDGLLPRGPLFRPLQVPHMLCRSYRTQVGQSSAPSDEGSVQQPAGNVATSVHDGSGGFWLRSGETRGRYSTERFRAVLFWSGCPSRVSFRACGQDEAHRGTRRTLRRPSCSRAGRLQTSVGSAAGNRRALPSMAPDIVPKPHLGALTLPTSQ